MCSSDLFPSHDKDEEDAFQEEIMEFAFKICKVPLTKTSDSLDWINSKFRTMDVKSHSYRNALRRVEIKLSPFIVTGRL